MKPSYVYLKWNDIICGTVWCIKKIYDHFENVQCCSVNHIDDLQSSNEKWSWTFRLPWSNLKKCPTWNSNCRCHLYYLVYSTRNSNAHAGFITFSKCVFPLAGSCYMLQWLRCNCSQKFTLFLKTGRVLNITAMTQNRIILWPLLSHLEHELYG